MLNPLWREKIKPEAWAALLIVSTFFLLVYLTGKLNPLAWSVLLNGLVIVEVIQKSGKIKPEYTAALFVVGIYCLLVYLRGGMDYFSWSFLFYAGVGFTERARKEKQAFPWNAAAPIKEMVFYGCFLLLIAYPLWESWVGE